MVDEAKRYTIAYGLGFEAQRLGSSTSATSQSLSFAPRGTLELTKANLTGRADSLSFKARASTIQGRALLTYIAPNYFAIANFSLQLSAYYENSRDVQTFDSRRAEGSVRLAQKLSSSSSMLYRYAYRHVVASNLQIAVEEIPLFSQNTEVSEFDVNWLRDRRNSVSDPSRGDFENVDVSLAMKADWLVRKFYPRLFAEFDVPLQSAGGWSLRAPRGLAFRRPTAIRVSDGYSAPRTVLRRRRHVLARIWPQPGGTARSRHGIPDRRTGGC